MVRVAIVIGALETERQDFEKHMEQIGVEITMEHLQNTSLLGTAPIHRMVLEKHVEETSRLN